MILPETERDMSRLRKKLAEFHAAQAAKTIDKLSCPIQQKFELIDAVASSKRNKLYI